MLDSSAGREVKTYHGDSDNDTELQWIWSNNFVSNINKIDLLFKNT